MTRKLMWANVPGVAYPARMMWAAVEGVTYPARDEGLLHEPKRKGPKGDTIRLNDPRSLAMATKAAGMMAAGDSLAAVARSMGMAADTLSYHVRKHGFTIKNHPATKTISDAALFAASQRIKAKESTRKQESARLGLADSTLKVKLRRFREAQAMKEAA